MIRKDDDHITTEQVHGPCDATLRWPEDVDR